MGLLSGIFSPPSRDDFAQLVKDELRAQGEKRPIRWDPSSGAIIIGTTNDARTISVANLYGRFIDVPRRERKAFVAQLVSNLTNEIEPPKRFAEAKQRLMPQVRARAYFSMSTLQMRANGGQGSLDPIAPLTDDLAIGLVLDYPNAMHSVLANQLKTWEVDTDVALRTAVDNLRARTEGGLVGENGVWVSPWEDNYDTSRLLMTELFTSLGVKGRPVALAPHRDLLVVTGEHDTDGLSRMAEAAQMVFEVPYPISPEPLVLDGGTWRAFDVPRSHPAWSQFRLARLLMRSNEYDDQKKLLERMWADDDDSLFPASYVVREKEGVLSADCTWTEDVPTLLPKCDRVFFVRNTGAEPKLYGFAKFDDVMRVMGDSLKPHDMVPDRLETTRFPTDAEMRAMSISLL